MNRWPAAIAAGLALAVAIPAVAAQGPPSGTDGPDVLVGTKRADTIRGRGGDDSLAGRGGDDLLAGGQGSDEIAGGPGTDRCRTDAADPAPRGCEEVSGPAGPLAVSKVTGNDGCLILRAAENCYFVIEGSGADAATGTVSGSGGVRVLPPGGEVSARDGRWSAHGTYACDADGSLEVTIAAESASVVVDCPEPFQRGRPRAG